MRNPKDRIQGWVGGFKNLLGGAVWKLEEVLVVREVVVQRCILLRARFLKNLSDLVSDDLKISRGKTGQWPLSRWRESISGEIGRKRAAAAV